MEVGQGNTVGGGRWGEGGSGRQGEGRKQGQSGFPDPHPRGWGGGPLWARHTALSVEGPRAPAAPSLWAQRRARAMRVQRAGGGLSLCWRVLDSGRRPRTPAEWPSARSGGSESRGQSHCSAGAVCLDAGGLGWLVHPLWWHQQQLAVAGGREQRCRPLGSSAPPPLQQGQGGISGFGRPRQLGPVPAEGEEVEHGWRHLGQPCGHRARGLAGWRAEFSRVCSREDGLGKELGGRGSLGRRG